MGNCDVNHACWFSHFHFFDIGNNLSNFISYIAPASFASFTGGDTLSDIGNSAATNTNLIKLLLDIHDFFYSEPVISYLVESFDIYQYTIVSVFAHQLRSGGIHIKMHHAKIMYIGIAYDVFRINFYFLFLRCFRYEFVDSFISK